MVEIGQILNDTYKIIAPLGEGGGGTVFLAYHMRMNENVAVKLIKNNAKEFIHNRAEADILKGLKNDFLPQVIDFAEDGNDVYTVMEYIEGKNFKQLIEGGRRFSEEQVIKYGLQLCSALKYLHSRVPPIIHSDIKPSNIMLTPYDNICLIDFNISMMSENGLAVPVGGSKNFAAPEQFRQKVSFPIINAFHEETRFIDDEETELDESVGMTSQTKNLHMAYIDIRTDIYGAGASLYYILTGRIPVADRLDFRGINVSAKLRSCLAKAICKDPDGRFKNADEFEKSLSAPKNIQKYAFGLLGAVLMICAIGAISVYAMQKRNNADAFSESSSILSTGSADTTSPYTSSESITVQIIASETTALFSETKTTALATSSAMTTSQFSAVTEQVTSVQVQQNYSSVSTSVTKAALEQTTTISVENSTVQTVAAEDFTSYYVSGVIHSKLTKQLSNGGYEVTWYWQNGLEKYIESYNADNELINLRTIDLES